MSIAPFRILHLSDLHLSEEHAWDSDPVLDGATREILKLRDDGLKPDLVAVTGDLAKTGKAREYDRVRQWIDATLLCDTGLKLKPSQIVIVPGNHDVDRTEVQAGAIAIQNHLLAKGTEECIAQVLRRPSDRAVLFARHNAYLQFLKNLNARHSDSLWSSQRYPHGPYTVHVAGLCSSWMSWQTDDKGRLLIGRYQLSELTGDAKQATISIALVHHPVSYLADFDQKELEQAFRRTFRFVLRGHLHSQETTQHASPDDAYYEFACGALYSGSEWPNAFQLIELDFPENACRIHYRLWRDGEWIVDRNRYKNTENGIAVFPLHPAEAAHSLVDARSPSIPTVDRGSATSVPSIDHSNKSKHARPQHRRIKWNARAKVRVVGFLFTLIAIVSVVALAMWHRGTWSSDFGCLPPEAIKKLSDFELTVVVDPKSHDVEVIGHDLQLVDLSEVGPILHRTSCGISLTLDNCDRVTNLDALSGTPVTQLNAMSCDRLTHLWETGGLKKLTRLNLTQSRALRDLDGCSNLSELKLVDATECEQLESVSALKDLPRLEQLILTKCHKLATVAVGGELPLLKQLEVIGCWKLTSLEGLRQMAALKFLDISGCSALASLDTLPTLTRLEVVAICDNESLSNVNGLKKLPGLRKVYVGESKKLFRAVKQAVPAVELIERCPGKDKFDALR